MIDHNQVSYSPTDACELLSYPRILPGVTDRHAVERRHDLLDPLKGGAVLIGVVQYR
jgi:hypothetical protein